MGNNTYALVRNSDAEYTLTIKNGNGEVILQTENISFAEAVVEIENRMYMTEENDDDCTAK